jgi:molecular chaperone GrpE
VIPENETAQSEVAPPGDRQEADPRPGDGTADADPARPATDVPPGEAGQAGAGGEAGAGAAELTVEDLVTLVEQLTAERNSHYEARARLQAEFDNYRKRLASQQVEQAERAAEGLVNRLLPVLDACDAAIAHNVEGVEPISNQLVGVLEREGLSRLAEVSVPFDPAVHEAVIHEEGDGPTTVVDVLRTGYLWKGRVVRPAMVKVRG